MTERPGGFHSGSVAQGADAEAGESPPEGLIRV